MPTAIHCIRFGLTVAPIFLLAGCWKEIEYTGSTAPPPNKPATTTAQVTDPSPAKQAMSTPVDNPPATVAATETSTTTPPTNTLPTSEPAIPAGPVATKTTTDTDRYAIPPKSDATAAAGPSTANSGVPRASTPPTIVDDPKTTLPQPGPPPTTTGLTMPAKPDVDRYATQTKRDDSSLPPKSEVGALTPAPAAQPKAPARHTDGAPTSATARVAPRSSMPNTRRAAWRLGSRLSQAALANDRGMSAENVTKWYDEAASAARLLGTSIPDLPESTAAIDSGQVSQRVLDYLGIQYDRIARDLSKNNQTENAALFEIGLKSNFLILLYSPGNSTANAVSSAISRAAPQAKLPAELWRPLVEMLGKQSPVDDVRAAVRKMHMDVDEYLANSAEPKSQ
jgi:hypothetical protein